MTKYVCINPTFYANSFVAKGSVVTAGDLSDNPNFRLAKGEKAPKTASARAETSASAPAETVEKAENT